MAARLVDRRRRSMARPFRRSLGSPSGGRLDARVRGRGPSHRWRCASEGVRRGRRRRCRGGGDRERLVAARGDRVLDARRRPDAPLPAAQPRCPCPRAPTAHRPMLPCSRSRTTRCSASRCPSRGGWTIGRHACRPRRRSRPGGAAVDERGERIDAPGTLPGGFALARSQLLLGVHDDPAAELLTTAARWRLSNDSSDLLSARDAARAAQLVADRARKQPTAVHRAALVDARVMLDAIGDRRAAADIDRVVDRLDEVVSRCDDDVALRGRRSPDARPRSIRPANDRLADEPSSRVVTCRPRRAPNPDTLGRGLVRGAVARCSPGASLGVRATRDDPCAVAGRDVEQPSAFR